MNDTRASHCLLGMGLGVHDKSLICVSLQLLNRLNPIYQHFNTS